MQILRKLAVCFPTAQCHGCKWISHQKWKNNSEIEARILGDVKSWDFALVGGVFVKKLWSGQEGHWSVYQGKNKTEIWSFACSERRTRAFVLKKIITIPLDYPDWPIRRMEEACTLSLHLPDASFQARQCNNMKSHRLWCIPGQSAGDTDGRATQPNCHPSDPSNRLIIKVQSVWMAQV
jgi:hypothetical protein